MSPILYAPPLLLSVVIGFLNPVNSIATTSYLSLGSLPVAMGSIYNPNYTYTSITDGQYVVTGSVMGVAPPSSGWPVVIVYHGGGETSKSVLGFSDLAQLSAVVIAPLGQRSRNEHSWMNAFPWLYYPPRDDATFTNRVLQDVSSLFPLDHSRIYITGKSDGGGMTLFVVQQPQLFSFIPRGVVPVSGAFFAVNNKPRYTI